MPKLTSRILVINDEPLVLREFVKGLNAAARTLDNPLGISFTGVTTAKEALSLIESDRDLQSVLVDDRLYSLARNGSNSKKKLQMSSLQLVQRITRSRPELDVYILTAQEKEDDVVDKLFTESVDGYFYREERDYRGIYRILNAQVQERSRTPFYDQLKNYVWMAKDSDRKSTRLNSSHRCISYAVFCLKKKTHHPPARESDATGRARYLTAIV